MAISARVSRLIRALEDPKEGTAAETDFATVFHWSESLNLKSENGNVSIIVQIKNCTQEELSISWINYKGKPRAPAKKLAPGKTFDSRTFATHPFLISAGDTPLYVFVGKESAKTEEQLVEIYENDKIVITKAPPKEWKGNPAYEKHEMCGWCVMSEKGLYEKMPGLKHALFQDLVAISKKVPEDALSQIRCTKIYVNERYIYKDPKCQERVGMCFHPSAEWLKRNSNLPEKAECVEIYKAKEYLQRRGYMPWVILHELSHSLHWHISYEHEGIKRWYKRAMDSGLYGEVPFILGGTRPAYAATNQMEYFAESSEAYWGLNDFFPFSREELKEFDPAGFEMCETIWNLDAKELSQLHEENIKTNMNDGHE